MISQLANERKGVEGLLQTLEKIKSNLSNDWILTSPQLPTLIVPLKLQQDVIQPALWYFWLEPDEFINIVSKSKLKHKDSNDLHFLTDFLIRYAIAHAFWKESSDWKEWVQISSKTGNKQKLKAAIKAWIAKILRKAVDIAGTKDDERSKKRGDHVINNNVLSVYRDIIQRFVQANQLESIVHNLKPESCILRDSANPLDSFYHHNLVQNEMVAFCDRTRPPDTNAAAYGTVIEALRDACFKHMTQLYHMRSIEHNQGTIYTAQIRELIQIGRAHV